MNTASFQRWLMVKVALDICNTDVIAICRCMFARSPEKQRPSVLKVSVCRANSMTRLEIVPPLGQTDNTNYGRLVRRQGRL